MLVTDNPTLALDAVGPSTPTTFEEAKSAYRRALMQAHPDHGGKAWQLAPSKLPGPSRRDRKKPANDLTTTKTDTGKAIARVNKPITEAPLWVILRRSLLGRMRHDRTFGSRPGLAGRFLAASELAARNSCRLSALMRIDPPTPNKTDPPTKSEMSESDQAGSCAKICS